MSQNKTENQKDQYPPRSDRKSEVGLQARIQIITWKTGMVNPAFWIQSKGLHAGRPLDKPIANCWAVYSDIPFLKSIAFSIYLSEYLRTNIIGSVVPFLRLSDYRPILTRAAGLSKEYDTKHLQTLEFLHDQIGHLETKIELFKRFQSMLAFKVNHELKIF